MPSAPFFILGAPRSGTTLLSMLLDSHDQFAIPYESHFIVPLYQRWHLCQDEYLENLDEIVDWIFDNKYVRSWVPAISRDDVDTKQCSTIGDLVSHIFSLYALASNKPKWGDKTPSYLTHANILNSLFADCLFIHLVRDGRDAALSHYRTSFGPAGFLPALDRWNREVTIARKMLSMLPQQRTMEIRYEDLVAEPATELKIVCDFLQIPFSESMLSKLKEKSEKVGSRASSHHSNLAGPIKQDSCYKWKKELSAADQHLAWQIAHELLQELGYEQGRSVRLVSRETRRLYHRIATSFRWRRGKWQNDKRLNESKSEPNS